MKKKGVSIRRTWPFHLMLLPGVILLLLFSYVPMAGIVIAFQKFNPAKGLFGNQKWVGWDNFEYVMSLPTTMGVLRNTLLIALGKIVLGMVISVLFALLLNEVRNRKLRRVTQTIIYFPHFLSWVILAGIFIDLLSADGGAVNQILGSMGIAPISFLGDKNWFPFTMILTDVWKGFGFGTVIYMATITSIDPTLYEAASIDGAGRFKQTLHITLPALSTIVILMAVLNMGNILNAGFDQIYNLYNAKVMETGDIIDTLVYRMGLFNAQFGPATAVGLFKSVVSMILISSTYFIAYKTLDYRIF